MIYILKFDIEILSKMTSKSDTEEVRAYSLRPKLNVVIDFRVISLTRFIKKKYV